MKGWSERCAGVDFEIGMGESVGVVGESGCGKSVTALSVMRLVPRPHGRIRQGHVWLWRDGEKTDVVPLDFDGADMRSIRGGDNGDGFSGADDLTQPLVHGRVPDHGRRLNSTRRQPGRRRVGLRSRRWQVSAFPSRRMR